MKRQKKLLLVPITSPCTCTYVSDLFSRDQILQKVKIIVTRQFLKRNPASHIAEDEVGPCRPPN